MGRDGTSTWSTPEQYLARRRVVPEMYRRTAASGRVAIPWEAMPSLGEVFVDDADLLGHLVVDWSRALAGSLDEVIGDEGLHPHAVDVAAAQVAHARPVLHALLAAYADHPVVREAAVREAVRAGSPGAPVHAAHVRPVLVATPRAGLRPPGPASLRNPAPGSAELRPPGPASPRNPAPGSAGPWPTVMRGRRAAIDGRPARRSGRVSAYLARLLGHGVVPAA